MAIRGETIGTAYVRILADGTNFDADAERQIRKADPTFEKAGEKNNDAYNRGWNSGLPRDGDEPLESFEDALEHGRGRYNRLGSLLSGDLLKGFEDEVRKEFPDVGDHIIDNLRQSLAKGEIDENGVIARLHNLRAEAAKAYDSMARDGARSFNELQQAVKEYGTELGRGGPNRRQLVNDLQHLRDVLPDAVTNSRGFTSQVREMERRLATISPSLSRARESYGKFGDTVGAVFGRGSRNDFLNWIGSVARGLSQIGQPFLKLAENVNTFRRTVSQAYEETGSVFSSIAQGITSIGGPLVQLVTTAAVIKLVVSGLGILGAAASVTTGLILALAGSLGFALVGGLVAVAGALVPFAAGIGVAALALAGLGKKNKGMKDLKKDFTDLKKTAAEGVFGKDGAGLANLSPILKSVKPLVEGVSKAIGGLLTSLGEATKEKGFKDMMKGIGDLLPGLVTKLGSIGGKLSIGLGQAFVAAGPLIKGFLGWVDKLSDKFVAFGKGGKNSGLAKFFNDAWASAKIVGGLISDIIGLIGDLFSAGKGTGDSIFKSIATQVQNIVKWLTTPEGQKALKQWFADAKDLAGALGGVVRAAIDFIDALDTEENRKKLLLLLKVIEKILDALSWLTRKSQEWTRAFVKAIVTAVHAVGDFFTWLSTVPGETFARWNTEGSAALEGLVGTIGGAISTFFTVTIPGWFTGLRDTFNGAMSEIGEAIGNTVRDIGDYLSSITFGDVFMALAKPFIDLYNFLIGNSLIPDLIMGIVGWFARLPGMVLGALGSLGSTFVGWVSGVPALISTAVNAIANAFGGLASKALAKAGNLVSAFGKWAAGLPAKAKEAATAVASGFAGLAGKIISRAGSIAKSFASWVSSLAGKARSTVVSVVNAFAGLAGKVIARAGSISSKFASWLASIPGKAKTAANNVVNAFAGVAGKIITKMGSLASKLSSWGSSAVSKAKTVATDIVHAFSGLASRIVKAIGDIVPKIKMPSIKVPTVVAKVITPKKAAGGVVNGAQIVTVGEAGPEAIVPLNRALSRVDPAVRALSAYAQGLSPQGSDVSVQRDSDSGVMNVTINTPTEDPRAVAAEVFARLSAASYV